MWIRSIVSSVIRKQSSSRCDLSERTPDDEKKPSRLWDDGDDDAEVFTLPALEDQLAEGDAAPDDSDSGDAAAGADADSEPKPGPGDYEAMSFPRDLDDFEANQYTGSTTQEYQGLAEEVSRAAGEEWEQQAVAAMVPGVDSGLVGFEDVTGARADTEEDFEASEQAATSDLAMRIAPAVVIFGLFLGSLLLGGWWFAAFVILAMIVSAGELYATARSEDGRPLALFGLLGVVFMGVGAQMTGAAAIAGWARVLGRHHSLPDTLTPAQAPGRCVGDHQRHGLGRSPFLRHPHRTRPPSGCLHPFVVLLVAANDTGAYFVGRAFGRRKLSPLISPKKTLEGLVGGLIAGLVVASILATFPAWETIGIAKALVAGAVVGLIAPLGDAVESMVKRSMGVKDMGSVLPATVGCSTGSMAFSSQSRPSTSCSAGSACCDPPGGRSRGDRVHRVPDNRGGHLARPGRRRPCRPIPIGEACRAGDAHPMARVMVAGGSSEERGIRAPGRATGRVRRRGGHRRSTDPGTIVVNGIVGAAGLRATLAGLECGNRVALANKESLVAGTGGEASPGRARR